MLLEVPKEGRYPVQFLFSLQLEGVLKAEDSPPVSVEVPAVVLAVCGEEVVVGDDGLLPLGALVDDVACPDPVQADVPQVEDDHVAPVDGEYLAVELLRDDLAEIAPSDARLRLELHRIDGREVLLCGASGLCNFFPLDHLEMGLKVDVYTDFE